MGINDKLGHSVDAAINETRARVTDPETVKSISTAELRKLGALGRNSKAPPGATEAQRQRIEENLIAIREAAIAELQQRGEPERPKPRRRP